MNGEKARPGPKEKVAQAIMVWAMVFGGLVGGAHVVTDRLGIHIPGPWLAVAAVPVAVATAWVSVVYWRNLDEAAREAHKFAWLWGGSGGLVLVMPVLPLLSSSVLEGLFGPHPPHDWVMGGLVGVLLVQLAGYGLAWAGWWLIRQR